MWPSSSTRLQRPQHHPHATTSTSTLTWVTTLLVPALVLCLGAVLLAAHLSLLPSLNHNNDFNPQQQQQQEHQYSYGWSFRGGAGSVAHANSNFYTRHDPLLAEEAYYLDDAPDYDLFAHIYEDDYIRNLKQQVVAEQEDQKTSVDDKSTTFNTTTTTTATFRPFDLHRSGGPDAPLVLQQTMDHPVYTALRDVLDVSDFFHPVCHRYRFPNASLFPTMSVIMPMQNERPGLLAMTVHSLLARTPPEILHEIIIIDDNGIQPQERLDVDEDEIQHLCHAFYPAKIKCIFNTERQGCAGSRLQGIRAATGDVIMVIDSHVEMYSSTWAQHLLLPLLENPRTVAMQALDTVDDRPGHVRQTTANVMHFGTANEEFQFSSAMDRFKEMGASATERVIGRRLPFETPFAAGSLFAMYREEFWRLGGYDTGLAVWGGENVELALKVWTCGYDGKGPPGRMVVVPCSHVGHVYRVNIKETGRWPPDIPDYVLKRYGLLGAQGAFKYKGHGTGNFMRLVVRNNMRVLYVWAGEDSAAMRGYYKVALGVNSTDPDALSPDWRGWALELRNDTEIQRQLEIKKSNKCKSFEWFDRHVLMRLVGQHHAWSGIEMDPPPDAGVANTSCGGHYAVNCGMCPQGAGADWCNGDCHWCPFGAKNRTAEFRKGMNERKQCVLKSEDCYGK